VPAALAGVFVGATVVTLEFAVLFFAEPEPWSQQWILPAFWGAALIVFLMGFVFLGVPAWFAAGYFGRRHWYDAVIIGAILTGGAEFLWAYPSPHSSLSGSVDLVVDGRYTFAGWLNAIKMAAAIGIGGAMSGLTIWWIAYRNR
jgi:hypothetical protein